MGSDSIDAMTREFFRNFSTLPGARLIDADGVFGVLTGIRVTAFNGIATTRLTPSNAEETIARTFDVFRSASCPFHWRVSPSETPDDLAAMLVARGLRHAFDWTAMTMDLDAVPLDVVPPPGVSIRRANTAASMDKWRRGFAGFERPAADMAMWLKFYAQCTAGWTHFIACAGSAPVATASLLIAGDVAAIYHVWTKPDARGQGIGAAITTAALRHARDIGATTAVLESTEMGLRVYRAIGFVAAGSISIYGWHPASTQSVASRQSGTIV